MTAGRRRPCVAPRRRETTRTTVGVLVLSLGALLAAGCAGASGSVPSTPARRDAEDSRRDVVGAPRDGPHDSVGAFLDAHFSADAWREDVGRGYFGSSSVWMPAGLALGAAAVSPWDRTISRHSRDSSPSLGDAALATLLVGTAAVGVLAPGDGREGGEERWTMCEAMALDAGATEVLKAGVGRRRPDSGSRTSFPSGHASAAFAAATLIDRNSGHALGIPAYALAAATAVSRVEARRHFPSDVLAGAALGVASAGIVDALHFGGEEKGEGISRRRAAGGEVGLDVGADGRVAVAFTLHF